MIKAILFDLGGVFFKVDLAKVNEEMMEKTKVSIFPLIGKHYDFYIDFVAGKITIKEYFDKLRTAVNINVSLRTLRSAYSKAYITNSILDQRMLNLLKELHSRHKLICITNTNQLHYKINKKRGLFNEFDRVFSSFAAKRLKSTDWYSEILQKLKLIPSDCLYIDDRNENLENAKAIGIDTILFKGYEALVKDLSIRNILVRFEK